MSKRILYVEDEERNRRLLTKYLTAKGYEVICAEDGTEGVKKAAEEKPDIILMDIHIPGLSGVEALQQLKNNPETADIPIIALTAHAQHGSRQHYMEAGFDDYHTKPFVPSTLLEMIDRHLNKSEEE